MYEKTGYYKDKKLDLICICCRNTTDKIQQSLSGMYGPRIIYPGNWCCTDAAGFSLPISDDEFQTRFEWICETDNGRIIQAYVDTGENK